MKKFLFIIFFLLTSYVQASTTCGFIGGTYFCLQSIDAASINWTSLNSVVQSNGINWYSLNNVINSAAINWTNPNGVINSKAINWNDINGNAKENAGAMNWPSLNQNITSQSVNWEDFRVFGSKYGNNSGINWQSFGV